MTASHSYHPDEQQLWRVAGGSADTATEAHVAGCAQCRLELETLRPLARYRDTTGGMVDPPPALESRLANLFRQLRPDLAREHRSPLTAAREVLRRITAELIVDTGASPQLAGLRGADRRTRQIAFVSDLADLDLEVHQREGSNVVAGQLGMDDVPPGLVISFSAEGTETVEAPVSADGHFTVKLPDGDWTASVQVDDAVLQFPGVRV
jgi:hypothetical protein